MNQTLCYTKNRNLHECGKLPNSIEKRGVNMRQLFTVICATSLLAFSSIASAKSTLLINNQCDAVVEVDDTKISKGLTTVDLEPFIRITVNGNSIVKIDDTDVACEHQSFLHIFESGWMFDIIQEGHSDQSICIQNDRFVEGGAGEMTITNNNAGTCSAELKNTGEYPSEPEYTPVHFDF